MLTEDSFSITHTENEDYTDMHLKTVGQLNIICNSIIKSNKRTWTLLIMQSHQNEVQQCVYWLVHCRNNIYKRIRDLFKYLKLLNKNEKQDSFLHYLPQLANQI